ncbi:hypothetical protein C8A01DRAFT_47797 [Parachaetomium inaequale]|uniref:Uncharacterized protein n=1 Tax=Parachaetomium inaequale TaxID=2588326 RepID=A0AAN6PG44_9PEZI|nr:hypothetical protein C8A01DRAFT_47797 [Parachaetomium inaequale]
MSNNALALLEPLTDPSATAATVQAAVQGLNDEALASPADVDNLLWDAFETLFDVVGRTPPERQGRLLEFLTQLQQTKAKDAEGKVLKQGDGDGEVWADLPTFGWVAREKWNFDETDPSATPQQRAQWENWTAFLAQLTAQWADDARPGGADFSMFALWALRAALEADGGAASQTAVRLAALWVCYAGAHLRKLSADGHALPARCGVPDGKYDGHDWWGFNEDRWRAWGEELMAAQGKLEPDEVIQGAVKLMGEL